MFVLIAPMGCVSSWDLLHEVETPAEEGASPEAPLTAEEVKDLIDSRTKQHALESVHRSKEQVTKSTKD